VLSSSSSQFSAWLSTGCSPIDKATWVTAVTRVSHRGNTKNDSGHAYTRKLCLCFFPAQGQLDQLVIRLDYDEHISPLPEPRYSFFSSCSFQRPILLFSTILFIHHVLLMWMSTVISNVLPPFFPFSSYHRTNSFMGDKISLPS